MPDPEGIAAGRPRAYAGQLAAGLASLPGVRLAAAYLHGSAVLGGWVAERSDVDILFVVADDIAGPAAGAAGQVLLSAAAGSPGRGLECSVVTSAQAARPAQPWPFVLHVGLADGRPRLHRGEEVTGDPDLLMHYAVCRSAGLALAGPPPAEVIGAVGRPVILDYLAGELDWGLANAPESYAVLNACRALVYLNEQRIVSKIAGGLAALDRGSAPAGLLRRALDQQRASAPEQAAGPDAILFVQRTAAALRAAARERTQSPPA